MRLSGLLRAVMGTAVRRPAVVVLFAAALIALAVRSFTRAALR